MIRPGLINNKLAQCYFSGQDSVGKQFIWGRPRPDRPSKWITVVGDTKLYGRANPSRFVVYALYRQDPSADMEPVVRSGVEPTSVTAAIRAAIAGDDKDQQVFCIYIINYLFNIAASDNRSTLVLLSAFSGFALLLAGTGIYGVFSYSTERRTHEIGIRMELGAHRRNALRLTHGKCGWLALSGVGLGGVETMALRD